MPSAPMPDLARPAKAAVRPAVPKKDDRNPSPRAFFDGYASLLRSLGIAWRLPERHHAKLQNRPGPDGAKAPSHEPLEFRAATRRLEALTPPSATPKGRQRARFTRATSAKETASARLATAALAGFRPQRDLGVPKPQPSPASRLAEGPGAAVQTCRVPGAASPNLGPPGRDPKPPIINPPPYGRNGIRRPQRHRCPRNHPNPSPEGEAPGSGPNRA